MIRQTGKGSRPNYGLGRSVLTSGYVRVWRPGHPVAGSDGYALEHRLVLHEAGVDLPSGFHVHHCNNDKTDNRIENLEVVAAGDHARLHWDERRPTHCPHGHEFTEENTAYNPSGWRYCKVCNRAKVAAARVARKAAT